MHTQTKGRGENHLDLNQCVLVELNKRNLYPKDWFLLGSFLMDHTVPSA